MGSVLISSICHYCGPDGTKANTQDHVVPRSILPKPQSRLPYWFRSQNIVPACRPCNGVKEDFRSDCLCGQCLYVWAAASKLYLPLGYTPKVVKVAERSAARRLGLRVRTTV